MTARTPSDDPQEAGRSGADAPSLSGPSDLSPASGSSQSAIANADDIPADRRPPEGMIWQCAACGKTAEDLYGMVGWRSRGWDESCMLNASPVPDTFGARS